MRTDARPSEMRAVCFRAGKVVIEEAPAPTPEGGELLIATTAAGLNGADMLQWRATQTTSDGPSVVPGLEVAGEVVGLGRRASRFAIGDRVMGILAEGGQAELAVIHERQALAVPAGLDGVSSGGIPETFTTAYDALMVQGEMRAGDRVLIHGAAGGVGTAAVQLARRAGGHVTATVRTLTHRESVAALGADCVVGSEAFVEEGPFDVILELVGSPHFPGNLDALATRGRIVVIGVSAGVEVDLNLRALMTARGTLRASTLRLRPLEEKATLARLVEREVLPGFVDGTLRVPIAGTFSLDAAADAYASFAAGGKLGKILLVP